MVQIPIKVLRGNDQPLPERKTENAVGYDVNAVLTRPILDASKDPYFNWKMKRIPAPEGFETVVDWMERHDKKGYDELRNRDKFPYGNLSLKLMPGEMVGVPLGFASAIPVGESCEILCRSGNPFKGFNVANGIGLIDPDYRDEWYALLLNITTKPIIISHGQSIVQIVTGRRETIEWVKTDDLPKTARLGGLGSTDVTTPVVTTDLRGLLGAAEGLPPVDTPPVKADIEVVESIPTANNGDCEIMLSIPSLGIRVGPIAKYRPSQYDALLTKDGGVANVASMLSRELTVHAPKVLLALLEAITNAKQS